MPLFLFVDVQTRLTHLAIPGTFPHTTEKQDLALSLGPCLRTVVLFFRATGHQHLLES